MASFIQDLWEAIFTAGPTPTLLLATNVTFGLLQVLLAVLLAATYSIHFVILSVLCGGLWWSINWFANELRAAQAKEEEAERLRNKKKKRDHDKSRGDARADVRRSSGTGIVTDADDEGDETEVEGEEAGKMRASISSFGSQDENLMHDPRLKEKVQATIGAGKASNSAQEGTSTGLQPPAGQTSTRQRPKSADLGSASELSTDSEWEKVSSNGDK